MNKFFVFYAAWVLACLGMLGSLYFSEMRHLEPCHLCWYQRICLYPLAIILGIAVYRQCYAVIPYIMPQVALGLLIAVYQVAIQEVPSWQPIELCGAGPSCLDKIDIGLGPITLPMLSAINFFFILAGLFWAWFQADQDPQFAYVKIK